MRVQDWLRSTPLEPSDKRVLMEAVTGLDRVGQITHGDRDLSPEEVSKLNSCAEKRNEGVPIPYLVGFQEFFSRRFKVSPEVLIPRPDTECLVEWALENIPNESKVADLGTGSGCIAETLALENPSLKVYASDLSTGALAVAKQNAEVLGAPVTFLLGSWLEPFDGCELDAIVSNPPYIHPSDKHLENLQYEPQSALTDNRDGLACIRDILEQCIRRADGSLKVIAIEHGWDQGKAVRDLFENFGFKSAETHKDYGGNDRFTTWKKL